MMQFSVYCTFHTFVKYSVLQRFLDKAQKFIPPRPKKFIFFKKYKNWGKNGLKLKEFIKKRQKTYLFIKFQLFHTFCPIEMLGSAK